MNPNFVRKDSANDLSIASIEEIFSKVLKRERYKAKKQKYVEKYHSILINTKISIY